MLENLGKIIGIVLAILVGIICFIITRKEEDISNFLNICFSLGVAFICGLIFVFIGAAFDNDRAPVVVTKEVAYQPVSMGDVMVSEGGGNWTYIKIDANQYYTFYYKDGEAYKLGKINASDAAVYQTNETEPKIIRISYSQNGHVNKCTYEIYVPEGSIVEQFNLNTN